MKRQQKLSAPEASGAQSTDRGTGRRDKHNSVGRWVPQSAGASHSSTQQGAVRSKLQAFMRHLTEAARVQRSATPRRREKQQ